MTREQRGEGAAPKPTRGRFLVLSTTYLVLSTTYIIASPTFLILSPTYPVLSTTYLILSLSKDAARAPVDLNPRRRRGGHRCPLVETRRTMAWVYIVRCRDDHYYVGSTSDLERRLAEHNAGTYCGYTSCRRPVTLVFAHQTASLDEAFHLERQIKGWSRAKKEALIAGRFDILPELSRSRGLRREGKADTVRYDSHPSTGSG